MQRSRVVLAGAVMGIVFLLGGVAGAWMTGYPYRFPQHEGIEGDTMQWSPGWDSITAATYRHPDDGADRVVVFFYDRQHGRMSSVTWTPTGFRCIGPPEPRPDAR